MSDLNGTVNGSIAPLKNVARFREIVEALNTRPPELPGFGIFTGKAGLGKTFSALYAINRYRAFYVECDETWTKKALCEKIMVELGLLAPSAPLQMPIYKAVEVIGNKLADNPGRPLIIDEADFLVKRKMIETVRSIYKYCAFAGASIILIGEEKMPGDLKMWERIDSRVLKSAAKKAAPIDAEDTAHLAELICPNISCGADVIEKLRVISRGSARRAVSILFDLREKAGLNGWSAVSLAEWDPAED